jgi:hypothetical protein
MSMLRLATWGWLAAVALAGSGTFEMKYQVAKVDDELGRVNRQIDADRDQLRVLSAEWSYLTQPARLDQLRQRHLALVPVTRQQLGSLDQIPFRSGANAPSAVASAPPSPSAPGRAALASVKP